MRGYETTVHVGVKLCAVDVLTGCCKCLPESWHVFQEIRQEEMERKKDVESGWGAGVYKRRLGWTLVVVPVQTTPK